jgi:hypothetical protein
MPSHPALRLFVAAAVSLLVALPAAAQTSAPLNSPRGQLIEFGRPLGGETGMAALAALASLEVSTAPLGTSTGGFTFTFDPGVRVWTRSAPSFGPSFAERSLTTGRGKVSAGFNWLHASYDSFNDQDLDNFDFQPAQNIRGFADSPAHTAIVLNFSTDTVVGYGHVGVTDSFDVGVAVPWIRVSMDGQGRIVGASGQTIATSTLSETTSSGVGDIAVFGKYSFFQRGGGGAAAAIEFRLPTGDQNAFRGLDVTRTLVSGIWSLGGKVSPHANVGYEFWSDDVLISSTTSVFAKDQFKYAVGVEFAAHPRATVVLDLVGRGLRHGGQVGYQTFLGAGGTSIDALVGLPEGLNQVSVAPGVKWNAFGSFLLTGNVLLSASNSGLRAKTIPVFGVDWAF